MLSADVLLWSALALGCPLVAWRLGGRSGKSGSPELSVAAPTLPPVPLGFLPVLPATAIFQEVNADPLLVRINQALGFAPENYARDVAPLLAAVAEFTQMLPASESHHHANPGGLITHLLEVAAVALLRGEEAKLPVGRPTDQQLKFAARWRFGILVGALLHDIGKPVADVRVEAMTAQGSTVLWQGLGAPLAEFGYCYKVTFPLKRDYGQHQRLPLVLLKSMVPASTMRWLADDPELVPLLVAYLSGEADGGMIGQLVKAADGKSVADNLLRGSRTRFATARQVPLIERLMEGMRRLLADGGQLALNREGAAAFCDGEDLWCVAGTLADKVRAYLDAQEVREFGAAALPTDNSRLFDVWMDYGALRANRGGAIWRATVTLEREGGKWTHTFTMLRFPLSSIFPTSDLYPKALVGSIVAESAPGTSPDVKKSNTALSSAVAILEQQTVSPVADRVLAEKAFAPESETANNLATVPDSSDVDPNSGPSSPLPGAAGDDLVLLNLDGDNESAVPEPSSTSISAGVSPTTVPVSITTESGDDEFLNPDDCASVVELERPRRRPAPATPAGLTLAVAPATTKVPTISTVGLDHKALKQDAEIERFMAWIQQGVGNGQIQFNTVSSMVHFVNAGMLLISPRVFREFLDFEGAAAPERDSNKVKSLQRRLQHSGYVTKNGPKTYLHYYRIVNAKNPARDTVIGYLVPGTEQLFNPLPEANPALEPFAGNAGAEAQ